MFPHHGFGFGCGPYGCGCHHGFAPHFHRPFPTKEERVARLKEYLAALQAEEKAVEEHLKRLSEEGKEE